MFGLAYRRCHICVVQLDHHCVFLHQCVGQNNMRHFLLFLWWTVCGCAYVVLMAATLLYRRWDEALAFWAHFLLDVRWSQIMAATVRYYVRAPHWLAAVTYLLCIPGSAMLGLGALLFRQLRLVCYGMSYLDALKTPIGSAPCRMTALDGLRKVFGRGPIWAWVLPSWHNPVPLVSVRWQAQPDQRKARHD